MTKRKVLSKREQRELETGRKAALALAGYHWTKTRATRIVDLDPDHSRIRYVYCDDEGNFIGIRGAERKAGGTGPFDMWVVGVARGRRCRGRGTRVLFPVHRSKASAMKALEQFAARRSL